MQKGVAFATLGYFRYYGLLSCFFALANGPFWGLSRDSCQIVRIEEFQQQRDQEERSKQAWQSHEGSSSLNIYQLCCFQELESIIRTNQQRMQA